MHFPISRQTQGQHRATHEEHGTVKIGDVYYVLTTLETTLTTQESLWTTVKHILEMKSTSIMMGLRRSFLTGT